MLKDSAKLLCLVTLSLSLLCFALLAICRVADAAAQVPQQKEIIVEVSLSKLQELNDLMNSQNEKINLLEKQLQKPTITLREQQNLINELRQNLQEAQNSLSKSELIIEEQNASLQSLSATMKLEQKRTKRIERQRLIWQVVAGGMVVTLIRKAT